MLKNILNTLSNCFKIPELKSRIFFTLMILGVCRVLAIVPIPGLDAHALQEYFRTTASQTGGLLGMYSMFTGGALEHCAIGALGIMPYITATIILQLMTAVVPTLSKLAREEGGRVKIVQYGRYLTVLLCIGWGIATTLGWENPGNLFQGFQGKLVVTDHLWWYRIQTVLMLVTGTMLLMWLGEQITDRGIGNGVSLVISIGILARLPLAMRTSIDMFFPASGERQFTVFHGIALVLLLAGVIAGIIAVTQAQRKIPVQYAQRAVGRKMYQGGTSFMPLKVNYAGVMPVIFASSILMFPQWIFKFLSGVDSPGLAKLFRQLATALDYGNFWYMFLFGLMILFFSYFWVATQFNELQIADDLKKNGGYIPGVRPGQHTSDFLHRAMSRITLAGAIFLVIIAVIPIILTGSLKIPDAVSQYFGGTSMLIVVGVMLDTMRQMESHLLMRHYDGFLKKGRVRGRL